MKDLTHEFMDIAKDVKIFPKPVDQSQEKQRLISNRSNKLKNRSQEAIHFASKAGEISNGIKHASVLLARLATLSKTRSSFSDPKNEINTISVRINDDVNVLQAELNNLENFLNNNSDRIGESRSATQHSKTIVDAMHHQLSTAAKEFQGVLKSRQNVLVEQEQRKGRFGASNGRVLAKPSTFRPQKVKHSDGLPRPYDSDDRTEEANAILEQTQLVPEQNYFEARANTMQFIESQINQIDSMMGNLAQIVASQSESITRIEVGIDESLENVHGGKEQLMKYYQSISGNKWLFIKIFGVLLFFLTFFIVFMA